MAKNVVDGYEMDKLQLCQLDDLDEIEVFQNSAVYKY